MKVSLRRLTTVSLAFLLFFGPVLAYLGRRIEFFYP